VAVPQEPFGMEMAPWSTPPAVRSGRSRGYTHRVNDESMASELDLIRDLYDYNARTRAKYLGAIWKLPPRARYQNREASYPSLVDIFMHVLDAYRYWFIQNYGGTEFEEYPLGTRYTRAQAVREMRAVDRYVRRVVRSLKPTDLRRLVTIPGRPSRKVRLGVMLVHMVEEELQHRGEMNALLWQAGQEPPITGFDD
jgi:uncharacterized damage-inducible protein DinB